MKNIVNIDRFFSAAHEAPKTEPEEEPAESGSFLAKKNIKKTKKHPKTLSKVSHDDKHVDVAKEILDFDSQAKAATKNYNPKAEVHDSAIIENPDEDHREKVVSKAEEERKAKALARAERERAEKL